jgi:hypothetical protein
MIKPHYANLMATDQQIQVYCRHKIIHVSSPFVFSFLVKYIHHILTLQLNVVEITGRGPIIANLHVTRERTQIFWPFFADDNNKW